MRQQQERAPFAKHDHQLRYESPTDSILIRVANKVSNLGSVRRKLNEGEILELNNFIKDYPQTKLQKLQPEQVEKKLAAEFFTRFLSRNVQGEDERLRQGLSEYQKEELKGLTTDENAYKFTAFHDERGNSVLDRHKYFDETISPDRSVVNDVKATGEIIREQLGVQKSLLDATKMMQSYLNPEDINSVFRRSKTIMTTYQNIALVRHEIVYDSRWKQPIPGTLTWTMQQTTHIGAVGSIRTTFDLKEVIEMNIRPFWIPKVSQVNQYYDKIRLFITEMRTQSTEYTEYPTQNSKIIKNYHFEFNITDSTLNRLYLTPINPSYKFIKPIARIENITFEFYNPFDRIIFPADSGIYTVSNTNPALFTLVVTPATPFNTLSTGDLVYVSEFLSANAAINTAVNRIEGYYVTVTSPTTFTIPVDLTPIAGPVSNVFVYYASLRIITNIEFTSLE